MTVTVRDHALWIRHIVGDADTTAWLTSIPAGASVRFVVDGVPGDWRRMADGPDGRSTEGFRPFTEPARSRWDALQKQRGQVVTFEIASDH